MWSPSEIYGECGETTAGGLFIYSIRSETIITCLDNRITLDTNNLIGNDLTVQDFGSCFTCYADALGQPAVVEINFTLSKGSGVDPQRDVNLDFMTSVSLRNY